MMDAPDRSMAIVSLSLSPAAHAIYETLKAHRSASRVVSTMLVQRLTCEPGEYPTLRAGDRREVGGEWCVFTEDGWEAVE